MKASVFGSATVESGKNKGKTKWLQFATGIKPENSNGLPVTGDVTYLNLSPGDIETFEFEDISEVQSASGEHFAANVVKWANAAVIGTYRTTITGEAKKLTLPPTSPKNWLKEILSKISPESILIPVVRAKGPKKSKVNAVDVLALANDTKLSVEERMEKIRQMVEAAAAAA